MRNLRKNSRTKVSKNKLLKDYEEIITEEQIESIYNWCQKYGMKNYIEKYSFVKNICVSAKKTGEPIETVFKAISGIADGNWEKARRFVSAANDNE